MTFGIAGSGLASLQFDVIGSSAPCWEGRPSEPEKTCVSEGALLEPYPLLISPCRLNLLFILWISTMFVCSGYPIVPSMVSGKSDYCLVLLNSCLAKVGRSEELALLKPYLEMPINKRSFRNGVGSGIKKTSFRRAKS
ncbi:neuropeptide S [Cygnus atratus]|uniref:neuropeptide S n=1 Tax=Cygnus atratus TaxID=8868 RepID=UPI0021B7CB26|nr:neuropeptide S [Cygnus atratus]